MSVTEERAATQDRPAGDILDVPSMRGRVAELAALRDEALSGPGDGVGDAQRSRGKLTVRDRIELLFDKGTFTELEPFRRHRAQGFGMERRRPYTDGVVTGWGLV